MLKGGAANSSSVKSKNSTSVEENFDKEQLSIELKNQFPSLQFENGPFDILYTYPPESEELMSAASFEKRFHNDSLLLVDDIHKNNTHLSIWEKLKNHPRVTVTVDLYYCGAVFFRQEQAREHFKIRI